MEPAQLPTVNLALGNTLAQMQAQSSYRLLTRHLLDDELLATDKPAIFTYAETPHGFTLPSARLITLTALGGIIYSVKIWPHLEYLSAQDALHQLAELTSLFGREGWERSAAPGIELTELENQLGHVLPAQDLALRVSTWHLQSRELALEFRKQPSVLGNPARSNQYLLSVGLFDVPLYRACDRAVRDRRAADGVPPSVPRPLPTDG